LEKSVQQNYHLDAWESIFIQKNINKHLLNEDMGNKESSLINIFSEELSQNKTEKTGKEVNSKLLMKCYLMIGFSRLFLVLLPPFSIHFFNSLLTHTTIVLFYTQLQFCVLTHTTIVLFHHNFNFVSSVSLFHAFQSKSSSNTFKSYIHIWIGVPPYLYMYNLIIIGFCMQK
jgi:hypothetical protein